MCVFASAFTYIANIYVVYNSMSILDLYTF